MRSRHGESRPLLRAGSAWVLAVVLLLAGAGLPAEAVQAENPGDLSSVAVFGVATDVSTAYLANSTGIYRAVAPYSTWVRQSSLGTVTALLPTPHRSEDLLAVAGTGDHGSRLYHSTLGGRGMAVVASALPPLTLVARAADPSSTIYGAGNDGEAMNVVSSADAGHTWTHVYSMTGSSVAPPTVLSMATGGTGPLRLIVGVRAYHGGQVVVSADGGTTWHEAALPGGLGMEEPRIVAANRGDLWAYWSNPRGNGLLFHSHDGGASWQRVREGLPATLDVTDIALDPLAHRVYLDVATTQGSGLNRLYTSADGIHFVRFAPGATGIGAHLAVMAREHVLMAGDERTPLWMARLAADGSAARLLIPHVAAPPVAAVAPACCGALFFPRTGHTLSGAFLAYYKRYGGLGTFGYPRTEPFRDGAALVQYTDRFRLELTGRGVVTAQLGWLLTRWRGFQPLAPFPSTPTRLYFPSTRHGLEGRFLAYWRSHDGPTLLGPPIAEVTRETNGDGSGRAYLMQWFERGRLEYHPELAGTRYLMQLGLLGKEDLQRRRWL